MDRRIRTSALVAAGGAALWLLVAVVFSTDRGLELTDEGLYLLALDPPSNAAHWQSPFGWSTAPLYDLVGHDVSRVRTAAIWLLVVIGAAAGAALARWLTPHDRVTQWAVAASGALTAPLLMANFLRTPGYNWANLIGLLLVLGGAATACGAPPERERRVLRVPGIRAAANLDPHLHVAAVLVALGVVVAVPAKPTSGPAALVAVALMVGPARGRRRLLELAALVAGWAALLIALAVGTGLWPTSFVEVLWRSRDFPPLHPNQTLGGAFRDLLRVPRLAVHELRGLRTAALALVAVATASAVVLRRRNHPRAVVRATPSVLCALAAVGTAVPWPVLGLENPQYRMAWTGTVLAAVLLLYGAVLHLVANSRASDRGAVRRAATVAVAAGVLVVAFGFGSAMGVFNQAAASAVLVVLAAAATATAIDDATMRRTGAAIIAASSLALVVSNTIDSRHHPYRNVDIVEQTSAVVLGAHDSTLLVEPTMAAELGALRTQARAAGFCSGTRLLGLKWNWSATEPFVLGAHVPDSLMLTIFGYPDALRLLPVTMAELEEAEWREAWVMTTNPDSLLPEHAAELRVALDRLPQQIGRTFPDDYVREVEVNGTQLWRPSDIAATACR